MNVDPHENMGKRTLVFEDGAERLVYGRLLEKTGSLRDKYSAIKLLVDSHVDYPMPEVVSVAQIGRVAKQLAEEHDTELEAMRSHPESFQPNPFMRVRDAIMVEAELSKMQ